MGYLPQIVILIITLLGLALPMQRASIGPPQLLYEEAQEADLTTAQALYSRLSEGFPEIANTFFWLAPGPLCPMWKRCKN